jgi:hypothetical protein
MPPQALPKFNLAKQPVSAIPNRPFTSYSREKQEPRLIAIVGAGENMQETSARPVERI